MKNTKTTKIAILVLSLALLLCVAIGFSVSAKNAEETPEILAQNIVYGDKVAIAYAVNASIEDAKDGTVTVSYYWEDDSANVKNATLLDPDDESNVYTKDGVSYPVFITEGVAPKELAKVAYATVDGENYKTYSAAEYLYIRLYEDGFASKTEADIGADGKDYNRKLLYENLLAYGEQAQLVFDYNTNKLVTDYSIAYTTSDLINLAGKSYVFGYGAISVEGTVLGEGTIAGWTVTDLVNGGSADSENVVLSLTGVYQVEPIFGVHECLDEDNDHLCDSCGEVASTCVNANATVDHKCDICGKVVDACADANTDGKCDVCKLYAFEYDMTSGVNLYAYTTEKALKDDSTRLIANQTTITENTTVNVADGYIYGVNGRLTSDPVNAANKVLQILVNNGADKSTSMESGYYHTIDLYAEKEVENGTIHVIEYDFYLDYVSEKIRNPFEFYVYDSSGRVNYIANSSSNGNYTSNIMFVQGTSSGVDNVIQFGTGTVQTSESSYALLNAQTWYRIRVVWNQATKAVLYHVSVDGGENWYQITAANRTSADMSATTVDHIALHFNLYGFGSEYFLDNISYTVTDAVPEFNSTILTDAVEATARGN